MLTPIRRHLKACSQYGKSGTDCPARSKVKCPYVIHRYENRIRRETALGTNDWDTAVKIVHQMVLSGDQEPGKAPKKIIEAIDAFFVEEKARGIRDATLKSFHKFLDGNPKRNPNGQYSPLLTEFAAANKLVYLQDFTSDLVTKFRQGWKVNGHAMTVQSERLKKFFRYAHKMQWTPTNPADALQAPNTDEVPVVAFSPEEIKRILKACGSNEYLRTFNLVMRYSALATVDAIKLGPDRLEGSHLKLHRTKTGTWVMVLLPPVIVDRLNALPVQAGNFWFWNRQSETSKHETATGNMRRMLRPIFKDAKVYLKDKEGNIMLDKKGQPQFGHPYQWRHTFVNEQLINGTPMERIAEMLGDKLTTVQDTYAHFVQGRQKSLDEDVKSSWNKEELKGFAL
jgi:integrase